MTARSAAAALMKLASNDVKDANNLGYGPKKENSAFSDVLPNKKRSYENLVDLNQSPKDESNKKHNVTIKLPAHLKIIDEGANIVHTNFSMNNYEFSIALGNQIIFMLDNNEDTSLIAKIIQERFTMFCEHSKNCNITQCDICLLNTICKSPIYCFNLMNHIMHCNNSCNNKICKTFTNYMKFKIMMMA